MKQLQSPEKKYELIPYKGRNNGKIIAHLGYNDQGKPFYLDFSGKSHFIIACKKGSGKTSLLHNIICSLIQSYSSDLVQFALVTGEKSGFSNYRNVPHVIEIAALRDELAINNFKDVCVELERRQNSKQTNRNVGVKHLFLLLDGYWCFSLSTKTKAAQYLNKIISKGSEVNVHLIITVEDISFISLWNLLAKAFPNKILFASSINTSMNLLDGDMASSISKIGEAYARFENSPYLHFFSAKANVRDIVKPYDQQAEETIRQQTSSWQAQQEQQRQFSQLDPYQFEEYVAQRMRECGYNKVQVTSKSGDYGADVLGVDQSGRPVCVQCKMYTGKVGFDAVQQINTARTLFNCDRAVLVTTSTLTQQAKETAKKLKVEVYEKFHAGSVIS